LIKIPTVLPLRYRLDVLPVKRRVKVSEKEKLVPNLKTIRQVRSGSKISRFFRYIFEHKHIRRILGSNIALFAMIGAFLPNTTSFSFEPEDSALIISSELVIKTNGHIQYPLKLKSIKINQGYHFFHPGIDFEGKTGDPVYAIMTGEVAAIQHSNFAYGNAILVRHGDNYSSLYAHLSKINVKEGQKVDLETILGEVGSSGRSSGDHLHLEIRENGRPINPLSMLPKL